jgi:hypothetical protein
MYAIYTVCIPYEHASFVIVHRILQKPTSNKSFDAANWLSLIICGNF